MKPSAILKIIAQAIIGYLLVWSIAYVATMLLRGDLPSVREGYDYFVLAWTFQAGELPGFIWIVSLAGYALVAGAAIRRTLRSRKP